MGEMDKSPTSMSYPEKVELKNVITTQNSILKNRYLLKSYIN